MRQLDRHSLSYLSGLLVLAFLLFSLSGVSAIKNATSGALHVVGDITWFGFLLAALAFIVTGVVVVVRRLGHRRAV